MGKLIGYAECILKRREIGHFDVGARDHRDCGTGAIDARIVSRLEVIDGREVGWREGVFARRAGKFRVETGGRGAGNIWLDSGNLGGFSEAVQGRNATHDGRERGGNLRIGRVGQVLDSADYIFVDLRMKRLFHLTGGSRKFNNALGIRHAADLEAM